MLRGAARFRACEFVRSKSLWHLSDSPFWGCGFAADNCAAYGKKAAAAAGRCDGQGYGDSWRGRESADPARRNFTCRFWAARRRAFLVVDPSLPAHLFEEPAGFLLVGNKTQEDANDHPIDCGRRTGRCAHFARCCHCTRQRGHGQHFNRHWGAGRPRGTWDTKERLDAAARGSDEHDNREQQSHAIAEEFDSAAKCPGLPGVPQMMNSGLTTSGDAALNRRVRIA